MLYYAIGHQYSVTESSTDDSAQVDEGRSGSNSIVEEESEGVFQVVLRDFAYYKLISEILSDVHTPPSF